MRAGFPARQPAFDSSKPADRFDFTKFREKFLSRDAAGLAEAQALHGKLGAVEGVVKDIQSAADVGEEGFTVADPAGVGPYALPVVPLNPPDWRQVQPGKTVRAVGAYEYAKVGVPAQLRLRPAVVLAADGPACPAVTAANINKDYAANPKGFDAKWKDPGRYYFVTGPVEKVVPIVGARPNEIAHYFYFRSPQPVVRCYTPPLRDHDFGTFTPGQVVTLLARCDGLGPGLTEATSGLNFWGVYVGRE